MNPALPIGPNINPTPQAQPGAQAWFFLAMLSALMAFTSLSTDIYLPAMPQVQRDLRGNVELTITGFLVGFALAQLVWGPLSDRIGRRRPLILGVALFVVGSFGCALSQSMGQIVSAARSSGSAPGMRSSGCWRVSVC